MIHFILVDTALELVPPALRNAGVVKRNIQKLGKGAKLLDSSLHHTAMGALEHAEKRGRPDILHHFLLDTLGSALSLEGHMQIHFHTAQGLFHVDPGMRCPRDYTRFKGLMAQLLQRGQVPPTGDPLIKQDPSGLQAWLSAHIGPDRSITLAAAGEQWTLASFRQFFGPRSLHAADWAFLVGGFQKGEFSPEIAQISEKLISFGDRAYDSWTVVNRLITFCEIQLGLI